MFGRRAEGIRKRLLVHCPLLETLRIEINDITGRDEGFPEYKSDLSGIIFGYPTCRKMYCNNCTNARCRDIQHGPRFSKLRHLELMSLEGDTNALLYPLPLCHFIQANRHALKSVVLRRICLWQQSFSWREAFQYHTQQNPGIELILEDVTDWEGQQVVLKEMLEGHDRSAYRCSGPCNK
jgi:hypothetical protein